MKIARVCGLSEKDDGTQTRASFGSVWLPGTSLAEGTSRKFLLFGTHQRNRLHIHITQFPESRTKFSYGKTSEVRSDINDSLASGNWDFLDRTKPEKATDLPIRNTIYTALKSRTLPSRSISSDNYEAIARDTEISTYERTVLLPKKSNTPISSTERWPAR
jgi:hypothetical protein